MLCLSDLKTISEQFSIFRNVEKTTFNSKGILVDVSIMVLGLDDQDVQDSWVLALGFSWPTSAPDSSFHFKILLSSICTLAFEVIRNFVICNLIIIFTCVLFYYCAFICLNFNFDWHSRVFLPPGVSWSRLGLVPAWPGKQSGGWSALGSTWTISRTASEPILTTRFQQMFFFKTWPRFRGCGFMLRQIMWENLSRSISVHIISTSSKTELN